MPHLKTAAPAAFLAAALLTALPFAAEAQSFTVRGEGSAALRTPAVELQRTRTGQLDARGLLPSGRLVNQGDAPVRAVVWFEPRDGRRGFTTLSPRRSLERPRSASPIASGEIRPGGQLSFSDFRMLRIEGVRGESTVGRLILALGSDSPVQVRGDARPPRGGWRFAEPEEEEVQMIRGGVFFPSDIFFPGDTFFPSDIFTPRR
jgi:hypothetical protein